MNGDASSSFMKRVRAWMSTVLPMISNVSVGGGSSSASARAFLLFLLDESATPMIGTALVCLIDVTQVYCGSARLTSSMMCGQTNRLLSIALMMFSWCMTES